MNNFYKKLCTSVIALPFLMGVCCLAIGAAIGVSWPKAKVTPVVIVEPSIGGFKPIGNSSMLNRWSKSQVEPVLLVKPSIGGFVPREGSNIGNRWGKKDVRPVVIVEPSVSGFVPLRFSNFGGESIGGAPQTIPTISSVIESRIDGDFEGWEGETIVKLSNGQIWQQSEYHYHYHYAFMPEVLIFQSGTGYKMWVEGITKAIGVERLK